MGKALIYLQLMTDGAFDAKGFVGAVLSNVNNPPKGFDDTSKHNQIKDRKLPQTAGLLLLAQLFHCFLLIGPHRGIGNSQLFEIGLILDRVVIERF